MNCLQNRGKIPRSPQTAWGPRRSIWCSADVAWKTRLLVACLAVCLLGAAQPSKKRPDLRHFKEDHLTGAEYLRMSSAGTYEVIIREHMGLWVLDEGTWSEKDRIWHFKSVKNKGKTFSGQALTAGSRRFIVWKGEDAPGIEVEETEIREALAKNAKQLPSYVFFEVPAATFDRETEEKYPFKFFPGMNDGKK